MKKFPVLQTVLILLFLGVLIFGFFISKKKTNVGEVIPKTQIQSTGVIADPANTSLYEAEQKQLQKKMENNTSYNNAVDTLDSTVCDKIIGDDTLKQECTDNVYSAQASKQKNVQLCDKIQDIATKARCISGFAYDTAIASGKQADCDKIIGDSDLKNACMKNVVFTQIENASFSGTTDICSSLTGADKDYCTGRIKKSADIELLQKGTSTKDINVCVQIQDVAMKTSCSDTVYMTLAIEKQDKTLCAKIIDGGRKTNCATQLARVADATLLQQAIAGNNLAICATITTQEFKTKCSDTIFLKQGIVGTDATMCAKIIDVSTKKQCSDSVKVRVDAINKQK